MGFSSAHRELTHCETQSAVRVAVPVASFLKKGETTPPITVSQHKIWPVLEVATANVATATSAEIVVWVHLAQN